MKPHPHSCRNCYGLLRRQRIMKEWQEWERQERPYASRAGDDDAGYTEEPAPPSEGVLLLRRHRIPSQGHRHHQWLHRGTGAYTPTPHQPDLRTMRSRRRLRIPGALPHGTAVSGGGGTGEATRCNRAACPMGGGGAPPFARLARPEWSTPLLPELAALHMLCESGKGCLPQRKLGVQFGFSFSF